MAGSVVQRIRVLFFSQCLLEFGHESCFAVSTTFNKVAAAYVSTCKRGRISCEKRIGEAPTADDRSNVETEAGNNHNVSGTYSPLTSTRFPLLATQDKTITSLTKRKPAKQRA